MALTDSRLWCTDGGVETIIAAQAAIHQSPATDIYRGHIAHVQTKHSTYDERDRLGLGLPLRPRDLPPLLVPAADVPELVHQDVQQLGQRIALWGARKSGLGG